MLADFLYPSFRLLLASLALALAMDLAYPEHRGLLLRVHPVRTSYLMALRLARPRSSRPRGVAVWLAVVVAHAAPAAALLYLARVVHDALWVLASAVVLKFSLSIRLLLDICRSARSMFERGDADGARRYVQMIVRRNVFQLDEPRVVSACIESLAESLVDGFASPLLYYALLGPLGALVQRLANTLDGAVGYKTEEYARVGWFSAKADTVLNYAPARLVAALLVLLAPLAGGGVREALSVWRRYRGATESVNAGHPMSAMAGALGVRLEKPGHYVLNEEGRLPEPRDIGRAVRVASVAAAALVAAAAGLTYLCSALAGVAWR